MSLAFSFKPGICGVPGMVSSGIKQHRMRLFRPDKRGRFGGGGAASVLPNQLVVRAEVGVNINNTRIGNR